MTLHVNLVIVDAPPGSTQPVEVEVCGPDRYRVLWSPGMVEGIAAGDVVRITDPENGFFEVLERGGNIAVKWFAPDSIREVVAKADEILAPVEARRDGLIERATVWTIPASAGFPAIEERMERIVALIPGSTWWFGNVYGEDGKPLNWW